MKTNAQRTSEESGLRRDNKWRLQPATPSERFRHQGFCFSQQTGYRDTRPAIVGPGLKNPATSGCVLRKRHPDHMVRGPLANVQAAACRRLKAGGAASLRLLKLRSAMARRLQPLTPHAPLSLNSMSRCAPGFLEHRQSHFRPFGAVVGSGACASTGEFFWDRRSHIQNQRLQRHRCICRHCRIKRSLPPGIGQHIRHRPCPLHQQHFTWHWQHSELFRVGKRRHHVARACFQM